MTGMGQLPGVKHKFIGLLSGGKDSCFNLIHCLANGHELVAIATLQPAAGVDELDSHMYQSVGTQLLPLIAQAILNPDGTPGGIPLYTHEIKGKAVEIGPEYGDREKGGHGSGSIGDETEDLTELLQKVMAAHPEATALSSGAILSNYQRLRIEHVCGRLGLVSLAYLWQSEQIPLLESMFRAGLQAILVKVAGVGLGVDTVGRDLSSMMPLFRRLERQYGSHPAGEGGEYETITLDTPIFSHRLKLTKTRTIITDPEPYPVAYLKVEEAELEVKEGWTRPTVEALRELLGLEDSGGMDEASRDLLDTIEGSTQEVETVVHLDSLALDECSIDTDVQLSRRGRWFAASVNGKSGEGQSIGEEIKRCFDAITERLSHAHLSLPLHAAHVTLLISDMSLFAPANAVYTTYFGTSPPSRATVAVPLPPGQRVKLEVLGFDDTSASKPVGGRQALHVQGLSYWAPANIGPYSQAVIVNSRLHIAGQIPLIPASLTLPPHPSSGSPYPQQAVLALQHVGRIVNVLRSKNNTGGGWSGWGESCVAWWAETEEAKGDLSAVRQAWRLWAEERNWEDMPVVFVQARTLPRGALVEYQVNLHTGRRDETMESEVHNGDADDEEELEPRYSSFVEGSVRTFIFLRDLDGMTTIRQNPILKEAVSIKVYHVARTVPYEIQSLFPSDKLCITFIPVISIHDREGVSAEYVLDVFGL